MITGETETGESERDSERNSEIGKASESVRNGRKREVEKDPFNFPCQQTACFSGGHKTLLKPKSFSL